MEPCEWYHRIQVVGTFRGHKHRIDKRPLSGGGTTQLLNDNHSAGPEGTIQTANGFTGLP
jgi:hypothetical protein